jgi:zinc transporter ZupT
MSSVFLVVGIEMFFAMRGAAHIHGSSFDDFNMEEGESHMHHGTTNGTTTRPVGQQKNMGFKSAGTRGGRPSDILLHSTTSTDNLMAGRSPSVANPSPLPSQQPFPSGSRSSFDSEDSENDLELEEYDPAASSSLLNGRPKRRSLEGAMKQTHVDFDVPIKPEPKALLQCLLLEAGILFHSVFIGMALSVTPAPAFYVLLIAISFHQTFEGLALGSRISALTFHPRSPHPWLMALAYGTTTPLGQAIGLAIHSMYDPASQTGLLSVGIMNALSSGLLLFAGLVELLAADFLSEESFVQLKGRKRHEACAAVVAGAGLMALVGAWA